MRPLIKSFITSFIAVAVIGCDGVSGQSVPVSGGSIDINCEELLAPLQRAIDIATTGAVINVTGMCFEDEVRVPGDKADLTIQGVPGTGAGITSAGNAFNLIIFGSQIEVTGLTITGGRGVMVDSGTARIIGNEIIDGAPTGIAIHVNNGGVAKILSNVIRGFGRGGIMSTNNSMIYVGVEGGGPGDPQPNLLDGAGTRFTAAAVKIRRTARGRVEGNCIRGYGQYGVSLDQHASAHVAGNVIADNRAGGIRVTEQSVLTFSQDGEQSSIHNADNSHLLDGVKTLNGTQVFPCADFESSSSDFQPNGGIGIQCVNTSVIRGFTDGTTVGGTVSNLSVGATCFDGLGQMGGPP